MKSEVKAIAISPNKDSIIYGGVNGNYSIILIMTCLSLVLKMMKIEEDFSIGQVLKNFTSKNTGAKGATEIKWNQSNNFG